MNFMRIAFMIILLLFANRAVSQNQIIDAGIGTSVLTSSGKDLPFWLVHNQLGKFSSAGNMQELTEGKFSGAFKFSQQLNLTYGTDLALLISEEGFDPKVIQAFAGISGKMIGLKAGVFADEEILGGLSSGNGDIVRSLNCRPYPMIRLSTQGFVPFPVIAEKWFRVQFEYDEGWLENDRIIHHPHLHHKSLAFMFLINESFRISTGFNHYVFWGGYSDEYGQLPDDLKSYFRYILGQKGDSGFLEPDRKNVAGNQLGSFLLNIEKDFKNYQMQARISHPFDDRSGMRFNNAQDNMYTLYFRKNKTGSFIDEILFEYLYTKNQSGSIHQLTGPKEERKHGRDNYFNHKIYQTGFSYKGYSMGTPLFGPLLKNENGTITGFTNNRISAFHAGAKGYLTKRVQWKSMLTWSRNFGTYDDPYADVHNQIYSIGELSWKSKDLPFLFSIKLAADGGGQTEEQIGLGFQVKWVLQ